MREDKFLYLVFLCTESEHGRETKANDCTSANKMNGMRAAAETRGVFMVVALCCSCNSVAMRTVDIRHISQAGKGTS